MQLSWLQVWNGATTHSDHKFTSLKQQLERHQPSHLCTRNPTGRSPGDSFYLKGSSCKKTTPSVIWRLLKLMQVGLYITKIIELVHWNTPYHHPSTGKEQNGCWEGEKEKRKELGEEERRKSLLNCWGKPNKTEYLTGAQITTQVLARYSYKETSTTAKDQISISCRIYPNPTAQTTVFVCGNGTEPKNTLQKMVLRGRIVTREIAYPQQSSSTHPSHCYN